MAPSKPSKDLSSAETTAICRKCFSTDGTLELVTSDERGEYLLQQVFSCTNVQMTLLPELPSYLCSACKSQFDFLDKFRSMCLVNNASIERFEVKVDTTHMTGSETTVEHSDADMRKTDGVESVVKTEVAAEDSEGDYQSSHTVSNIQQIGSTYDYNHHNDLFEAEEESLETLLKREPMDDQNQLQQPQSSEADLIKEEGSLARKSTMDPDDPASISDHNNLDTKYAAEGPKFNQMDPNGEEKSEHTGNQRVSVAGEQRLLRSNKRRSSQKDIAAKFSVTTVQRSKVNRNVHRNKQKHQCPHCSATFPYTFKLKDHIRTHTGEKPFMCEICGKTFHAANNLYLHMKIHNKDQRHCPHCHRKFAQQSYLKDHIRTHTGEKPFMCKACSKTFHAARYLQRHMKIHNKDEHQCPHCPRKFARQDYLKDHIRTHTGEKPFMCKVCSKTFHAANILYKHMKIHDKDQHQCPHCSVKFARQSQLKNHIRFHTDEKPFMCKVCSKTFHAANILYNHMKIHGKHQHQCPHCPRKFPWKCYLKKHVRTHTGE